LLYFLPGPEAMLKAYIGDQLDASEGTSDRLSAAEHADARWRAYFFALERGDGTLPPYDAHQAEHDFLRAAGEVTSERRKSGEAVK
jgi:hypothetical protein